MLKAQLSTSYIKTAVDQHFRKTDLHENNLLPTDVPVER